MPRKHLRSLENVTQLGRLPPPLNRVVDFRFDSVGAAHHLLCWQLKLKYLASQVKTSIAQASRNIDVDFARDLPFPFLFLL